MHPPMTHVGRETQNLETDQNHIGPYMAYLVLPGPFAGTEAPQRPQ